jgi:predicted dehydrogenase
MPSPFAKPQEPGEEAEVLKVGAIGCGTHALGTLWPQIAGSGLVLHAVCSQSLDKARDAARLFGVARFFDDPARMIATGELDAVLIVVAPPAYAPLIQQAIDSGLPAFVEKPGADTVAEATALARAAEERVVPVVVGYQKRFAGAYRRARELMQTAEFGPPTLLSFTWAMGPFGGRMSMRDWLFENPVHMFDMARFLAGELDDVAVQSAKAGEEYVVVATGRAAATGALVSIRANTTASWSQHNESVEIFGTGHALTVENMDTLIHRPPDNPERVWRPNYTVPTRQNFSGETLGYGAGLRHFVDVVRGRAANDSDLGNAAATLALTERIAALATA